MGGGRKTKQYTLPEKSKTSWSLNCSTSARNLGKAELAGVIFGCTNNTMEECISKQLFGLPASHISYVKHIRPGLPLFLFNYSDRKLHGIFEAASEGKMNINPCGWSENGSGRTRFPAQVRVRIQMQCQPLIEDKFGHVIIDNYYESNHFWFELDQSQTSKLISMFTTSPVFASNALNVERVNLNLNPNSSIVRNGDHSTVHSKAHIRQSSFNTHGLEEENWSLNISNNEEAHRGGQAEEICLQSHDFACKDQSFSLPQKKWNEPFAKSITTDSISAPSSSSLDFDGKSNSLQDFGGESGQFYEEFDAMKQHTETQGYSLGTDNDPYFPQKGSMEIMSPKTNTSEGNISLLDRAETGNCSLPEEEFVSDVNSQSTMNKMLEEVHQLKLNQVKQDQKIRLLEEELVESRRVIKNLNQLLEISERSSRQQTDLVKESASSIGKSILIIGGFDGVSHLSCLDCYCPSRDSLEYLCPMSSMRSYTSAVKLNGEVYVIGGECYNSWYDTVESYNLEKNQWVTRPSMNQKKGSLAGIYLNEKIFAIGGSNGVQCFSEVEVFDINVGMWIPSKSMQDKRFSLAAAEINGAIYAVGGYDGKDYLKSLERYDLREPSWRRLESMSTKRSCHSLAVLNEKLYVIGGYNGEQMVSTVEVYDPRVNHWTMVESMNNSRGFSSAVVIGNSIFAMGGLVENNVSNKVEYYTETQGWRSTNLKALGKRCSFSAVVL
ncbi:kelch-like protein 20 [Neltuma alba]|uniref:kelch-like protein 20 n=1 Tax=Neltuma alba TaxID=207710 RepID=UPI0010A2D567|nr:kelch-like protein 20 [Prosopis alba]